MWPLAGYLQAERQRAVAVRDLAEIWNGIVFLQAPLFRRSRKDLPLPDPFATVMGVSAMSISIGLGRDGRA